MGIPNLEPAVGYGADIGLGVDRDRLAALQARAGERVLDPHPV